MGYTKMKTIDEIKKWLKDNLNEERYFHSLGVADCARDLAEKYGLDKEKCYLAGLVHDCAKCYKNEDLLEILQTKMHCDMEELLNPKTYHSPAGAYLAKELFGIDDKEILDAIYCHTVGKEKMSVFEKVIFAFGKRSPRHNLASIFLHVALRLNLLIEHVSFNLVDHRLDFNVGLKVDKTVWIEVADADGAHKAFFISSLHCPVRAVVITEWLVNEHEVDIFAF